MADDFYTQWYSAKLWQMLPAIYRTLDAANQLDGSPLSTVPGPLQEFCNRIGAQAALLRRSIDRLWENQSIETCDDWVIPYIGDLLATRMVSCLDARAQRLDVAKTIYYRRRSGTLGLIEELASDIAGHDARAVEFFRRLARTRHNFDPPIGLVPGLSVYPTTAALLAGPPPGAVIEGLAGPYSRTPAGGYADLRNAYCRRQHPDSLRRIRPHRRFPQRVANRSAGRTSRTSASSSGGCVPTRSPMQRRWSGPPVQASSPSIRPAGTCSSSHPRRGRARILPTIGCRRTNGNSRSPFEIRFGNSCADALYPNAFSIALGTGDTADIQPFAGFAIDPPTGRFRCIGPRPPGPFSVSYNFGFSSDIGAGGFDPGTLPSIATPAATIAVSGAANLDNTLAALDAETTLLFTDSITAAGPVTDPGGNASSPSNLAFIAAAGARPVLRWKTRANWTLTGRHGTLVLQGLWLQGADLILAGAWDQIVLRHCTIDPGTADPGTVGATLIAIDGVPLARSHIVVTGQVNALTLQNCITGPIRTIEGGAIATLTASDSIIQSIPTHAPGAAGPLYDPADLAARLRVPGNPAAAPLLAALDATATAALDAYVPGTPVSPALLAALEAALATQNPAKMQEAFPLALADLALGADSGSAILVRTTVLGPIYLHELSASECILDDIATVDDPQDGCVRFSTLAAGHNLHAPYRCATVPPHGPIFASRQFGDPRYARLRPDADQAVLTNPAQQQKPSVLYGAANGAEPGAFAGEAQALAQRGLAQKLEEYSPIGLTPVWVDADL